MAQDLGQLIGMSGVKIDPSAILGQLGLFATIVVIGAIFLVIILVMRYILGYSKKVSLLVKANKGMVLMRDKGKPDFNKKEFTLLKNKNIVCPFPESIHYVPEGKKDNLFGYVVNNSCTWLTVSDNPHFVPTDINMMNFVVDMYARIDEATKIKGTFWDKYGHQILWGLTIAIFLIAIIFILKSVDKAIQMGTDIGKSRVSAVTQELSVLPLVLWRLRK